MSQNNAPVLKKGGDNSIKTFMVTTPIYYINDKPHIGHTYATFAADIIARYHRLIEYGVLFTTGCDVNSKKTVVAAQDNGYGSEKINQYIKNMGDLWQNCWDQLNISYDDFILTNEDRHYIAARTLLSQIYKSGDIYEGYYEGKYCYKCETFYKDEELLEGGLCPNHKSVVEVLKEKNYFFKLSKYADQIKNLVNQGLLSPSFRANEIMSFIDQGLEDISISRENVQIGIPLPWDESQKAYVWVEALINYLTCCGYPNKDFTNIWPADLHIVGKDITRFHAVIWPAMLLSAKMPVPKKIFAHGFFTINGEKISKSLNNSINPLDLVSRVGIDGLKYYLFTSFPFGNDGDYSDQRLIDIYNGVLGNKLGNLMQRTIAMIQRYNETNKSNGNEDIIVDNENIWHSSNYKDKYHNLFANLAFDKILEVVFNDVDNINKEIEDFAPWVIGKDNPKQALEFLIYNIYPKLVALSWDLSPILHETHQKMLEILSNPFNKDSALLFPKI